MLKANSLTKEFVNHHQIWYSFLSIDYCISSSFRCSVIHLSIQSQLNKFLNKKIITSRTFWHIQRYQLVLQNIMNSQLTTWWKIGSSGYWRINVFLSIFFTSSAFIFHGFAHITFSRLMKITEWENLPLKIFKHLNF